ncbi:DNA cytosine methyltransferase [Xylella fastidiosa]|uniref:DNA cytosine methyltransferase n=1 Tax=Xylella fastidiosa subsp. fastidiosa TaxID=644356 RepID=A0AAJ5R2S3_XYLFS|nr:DNA cytosine methyltransferase [Xylella fastidiosa]WCF28866.1 DNA cytosine methyltransferase [Xylella fastidiosa subsp. fastidiosa]WNY19626.1 DNA cytosine methyltransferase [Xylella fastidiosa]WNY21920.1 DNA cytosine methyltransferase [Xylella fastidiosa]
MSRHPRRPKNIPNIVGVDLFCGVGGLTHGLARGGISVAAGIDIDPNCQFPLRGKQCCLVS